MLLSHVGVDKKLLLLDDQAHQQVTPCFTATLQILKEQHFYSRVSPVKLWKWPQ